MLRPIVIITKPNISCCDPCRRAWLTLINAPDWGKDDGLCCSPRKLFFSVSQKNIYIYIPKILFNQFQRLFASSAQIRWAPIPPTFNPIGDTWWTLFCSGLVHRPGFSFRLATKKKTSSKILSINSRGFASSAQILVAHSPDVLATL